MLKANKLDGSKPFKELLDDDNVKQMQANPDYKVLLSVVEELVNYSSNLFARCFQSLEKNDIPGSIILLNVRNMIELADSIHVLAKACAVQPSFNLLRSLYETLLNIEYILQNDSDYERRAFSYLFMSRKRELELIEKIIMTLKENDHESLIWEVASELSTKVDLSQELKRRQDALLKPNLSEVAIEYDRTIKLRNKKSGRNYVEWYSLFDGPTSIKKLAEKLERTQDYEMLYRSWSTQIHGKDVRRHLVVTSEGLYVKKCRSPEQINLLVDVLVSLMHNMMTKCISKYRSGEIESYRRYKDNTLMKDRPTIELTGWH